MVPSSVSPGPDAQRAFRLGMLSATILALVGLTALYLSGHLTLGTVGFTLAIAFPVYLVFVASLLSVWLGFDKDVTNLRPVYREDKRS